MYADEACLGECAGFGRSGIEAASPRDGEIASGSGGVCTGGLDQPEEGAGRSWEEVNPLDLPSLPLSDKSELPDCPLIYFVSDGSRVLYIGKSVRGRSRWITHHRYRQVLAMCAYPRLSWLEVNDPKSLRKIEESMIYQFDPILNGGRVPKTLQRKADKGRIAVYFEPEVRQVLEKLAEKEDRSASNMVKCMVEKALKDWQVKGGAS